MHWSLLSQILATGSRSGLPPGSSKVLKVPPNTPIGGHRKAHAEPRPPDSVMLRRARSGGSDAAQGTITRQRTTVSQILPPIG